MKALQLIQALAKVVEEYGDHECVSYDGSDPSDRISIEKIEFESATYVDGKNYYGQLRGDVFKL